MKKLLTFILVLLMLFGAVACGSGGDNGSGSNAPADGTGENQPSGSETGSGSSQSGDPANGAKLTGKMNVIERDDRDASILRGVTVKGNLAGTAEFNNKDSSLTDVRCVFELSEWVEFYPDTDKDYALRVWVLKHRDDQEYYNTAKFSDLMPNFATYCDLHYPADEEKPDESSWGSFYLNKEECGPGYYDLVFTYEGKAIATLLTRFYNENELTVRSDAALEEMMHE